MEEIDLVVAERKRTVATARGRERAWSMVGAGFFAGTVVLLLLCIDVELPVGPGVIALVGLAALVVAIVIRERMTVRRREAEFGLGFWERAQARRAERFDFGQDAGTGYADWAHLAAGDLDYFGPGSLFERINACPTVLGRDALADLMLHSGEEDFAPRTEAVRELVHETEVREKLEIAGRWIEAEGVAGRADPKQIETDMRLLLEWGQGETPASASVLERALYALLALAATAALLGWIYVDIPIAAFTALYIFNFFLLARKDEALDEQLDVFETMERGLSSWARHLKVLEGWSPTSSVLVKLRSTVMTTSPTASEAITKLARLVEKLARRRNKFWALSLGVIWLHDLQVLPALLAWKRQHGPQLRTWLSAAGRFEAHAALAAYAAAAKSDVWATIDPKGPQIRVQKLSHVLLPRTLRVANDLTLSVRGEMVIVTGSNMSGKSTFLRAVGLGVTLARLGLPVPATSLSLRPQSLATCMRVQDSLQRGASHFQAEVQRLRAVLDAVKASPQSLVLLDEILAGTNSRERHLGALAVLRELSHFPTSVLVSTHDLGLAKIVDEMKGQARVVHFTDRVENGRMVFDYTLREGPLPSTNALRVLRAAGIPVPDDPESDAPASAR